MPGPDDRLLTRSIIPASSEEAQARAYLLVIDEAAGCTMARLPRDGVLLVGRDEAADIRLDEEAASRRHARVVVTRGAVRVVDLGSRNGTTVNGERVEGTRALESGDVIGVGRTTLVLRAGRADRAAPPPDLAAARRRIGDRRVIIADPAMAQVYELLRRLAGSLVPVLVCGETGTGKENAAFAVHALSPRAAGPFVTMNCAALAETLLESQLFGHERGAFSGADRARAGYLEEASGGTVFLDEVGELTPGAQAKLLRALETKRIVRVGDTRERPVDVRLVAATNRDLEAEVAAGRFRRDLLYRLNAATVLLPPLRERPREIALLAREFLDEACARIERPPMSIAPVAMAALERFDWPGNVRELRNLMDVLAATCAEEVIGPEALPARFGVAARPDVPAPPAVAAASEEPVPAASFRPLAEEVRELERRRIEEALRQAGNVQKEAAALIGMPLRTFVYKLRQIRQAQAGSGGDDGDDDAR